MPIAKCWPSARINDNCSWLLPRQTVRFQIGHHFWFGNLPKHGHTFAIGSFHSSEIQRRFRLTCENVFDERTFTTQQLQNRADCFLISHSCLRHCAECFSTGTARAVAGPYLQEFWKLRKLLRACKESVRTLI